MLPSCSKGEITVCGALLLPPSPPRQRLRAEGRVGLRPRERPGQESGVCLPTSGPARFPWGWGFQMGTPSCLPCASYTRLSPGLHVYFRALLTCPDGGQTSMLREAGEGPGLVRRKSDSPAFPTAHPPSRPCRFPSPPPPPLAASSSLTSVAPFYF